MTRTASLTEREQQALEHLQKAQELGSSLREYCAAFGLEVNKLYVTKKQLVRKGILAPARGQGQEPPKADKPSAFVPVRIVPSVSAPVPTRSALACRLKHPSGWVIECDSLPPTSWIAAVLAGGADAAA